MFGWLKKEKDAPAGGTATLEKEAPSMKVKVLERKGCAATISVTVPAEEVAAAVQEAFQEIQKQARLPGFRQGKAPLDMIKKNFSGQALEHGINNLLRETVHHALDQEKIVPLAVPSVDKVDYHDGKPLKYEIKVECPPEVTLKTYKGLPLEQKPVVVTDADLEERLNALRENNAKLAPSADEVVADKHFALVDYEASLDGAPVEGGKAQDQLVELAAPQSIVGFNDALKGLKKGETKEVSLPFPAEHPSKALAGKNVSFKIAVKDIKEKQLPALDDEFAKDLGVESLAALKDRVRANLENERTRQEREAEERQIIEALLERHPFEVPASQVEERAQQLTARMKEFMVSQGASEADWQANAPKMVERNRPEAEKQVRLSYLLIEIAKKENIDAGDADVDEAIAKAARDVPAEKLEGLKKWFEERRQSLRGQLKEEKLFKFLIDHAQKAEQKPA